MEIKYWFKSAHIIVGPRKHLIHLTFVRFLIFQRNLQLSSYLHVRKGSLKSERCVKASQTKKYVRSAPCTRSLTPALEIALRLLRDPDN